MKLSHNGNRFELDTGYGESERAKKSGFAWDATLKRHYTSVPAIAKQFAEIADAPAREQLRKFETRLLVSQSTDANINIPSPPGLEYLGYQKAGIRFASEHANTLLGDEMRLGKSVQFLGLINYDTSIKRVLIIPPAGLTINWVREYKKWTTRNLSIDIATKGTLPTTDIVILNYEMVGAHRSTLLKRGAQDLLGCDEAHYLKNPMSKRTQAVLGSEWRGKQSTAPLPADRRAFLTGTPMLNYPVEFWPMLRVVDPKGLGWNFEAFTIRYCKGWRAPWGWDASGAANLDELRERLRSTFMIRRLKADVLPELPKKRRQIITIPCPEKARSLVKAENEVYNKNEGVVEAARREAEAAQARGDETSYRLAVRKLEKAEEQQFEGVSTLRQQTGLAKIPYALSLVEDVLLEQEKVVIFGHHRAVLEELTAKLSKYGSVLLYGEMSTVNKQAAVDRFTNDKKCRVFCCSIIPAVGFSLAVADYALCVEYDWRPLIMNQAEDRLESIFNVTSVLIQHLVFNQSFDVYQIEKLIKKQEIADKTLDG